MIRNPFVASLPILAAGLCLMACVSDPDFASLTAGKAHWQQSEPTRYSYTLEQTGAWISWKVRVTAVRGSVITVQDASVPGNEMPVIIAC